MRFCSFTFVIDAIHTKAIRFLYYLVKTFRALVLIMQVILVCHSMGGTTVARACERYPLRIHVAVYIAGAMLKSGMSQSENHDEASKTHLENSNLRLVTSDLLC